MLICGTASQNHDGGFTTMFGGTVISTQLSERYTRVKHDSYIIPFLNKALQEIKFERLYISTLDDSNDIQIDDDEFGEKIVVEREHHLYHAYCGFHTSPFDDAVVIVVDGYGCVKPEGKEVISAYTFKNNMYAETVEKVYQPKDEPTISIGRQFGILAEELGLAEKKHGDFAAGKVMGLAQYFGHESFLPEEYQNEEWYNKVAAARELQNKCNTQIMAFIQRYVKMSGMSNVVLTGGVALNCVTNNKILESQNDWINLHVDPVCNDNGISIGAALRGHEQLTGEPPNKVKNVYLGYEQERYNFEGLNASFAEYYDIIDLILAGHPVAIFQGRSEVGQRALGNRSIVYDPRDAHGQQIVNEIKQRESYRPFAATVMAEHYDDWFCMKQDSPYMSYAVDVWEGMESRIPSVTHADNTCRVQTLKKEDNPHFYRLINEFYRKTQIPMLLNTSFNIAGHPLVETFEDAIYTLNNSELKYIFIPEENRIITKQ
jgi:carbamoyltransferase